MQAKRRLRPILLFCLLAFFFIPDFYIQFFLLIFLAVHLLAFFQAQAGRWGLRLKRTPRLIYLYPGEAVCISFEIENRSFLPLANISLRDRHGQLFVKGESQAVFSFRPREKKHFSYQVISGQRGRFCLGPLELSGSDLFSLFPWTKKVVDQTELVVYPSVFRLNLPQAQGLPGGEIKSQDPAYEDLTCYRSLRDYIPGDELKRVNWKVSARLGRLLSMQYQPSLTFSALVLLNLNEEDYPLRYRHFLIEYAVQIAASLVVACLTLKQQTAFACFSRRGEEEEPVCFPFGKSSLQANLILEALATVAPLKQRQDVFELLALGGFNLHFGVRLMYVGPLPSNQQIERLLRFKLHGLKPELFLVGASPPESQRLQTQGLPCYDIAKLRL